MPHLLLLDIQKSLFRPVVFRDHIQRTFTFSTIQPKKASHKNNLISHYFALPTMCSGYFLFCQASTRAYIFGSQCTSVLALNFRIFFGFISLLSLWVFLEYYLYPSFGLCVSNPGTSTPPREGCLVCVPSLLQDDPSLLCRDLAVGLRNIWLFAYLVVRYPRSGVLKLSLSLDNSQRFPFLEQFKAKSLFLSKT